MNQENLDSFLAIAEELRLKGLMGQTEHKEKKTDSNYIDPSFGQMNSKPLYKREKSNQYIDQRQLNLKPDLDNQPQPQNNEQIIVVVFGYYFRRKFVSGLLQLSDNRT